MKILKAVKNMDKPKKKILGISLIVSAVTMLFTMLVAPKDKKGSRILAVIALLEALAGLCVAVEEPRRLIPHRKAKKAMDESELFAEGEAFEAAMAMSDELSVEEVTCLNRDIPCDEEATEADFM